MLGAGPLRRLARLVNRNFPSLNFITLHYIYFLTTCLVSSGIFYAASTPPRSVSYTDSLFVTVSAMTLAGLNTVNLSGLNTFQQFMLFFLIIIGSSIFVSAFVVHVRKRAFEHRFEHIAEMRQRRADGGHRLSVSTARRFSRSLTRFDGRGDLAASRAGPSDPNGSSEHIRSSMESLPSRQNMEAEPETKDVDAPGPSSHTEGQAIAKTEQASQPVTSDQHSIRSHPNYARTITYRSEAGDEIQINPSVISQTDSGPPAHITWGTDKYYNMDLSPTRRSHHHFMSMQGVGARPNASIKRRPTNQSGAVSDTLPQEPLESATNHLPFRSSGFVSRNSQFHHLSEKERQDLGGYEYKAIQLLSWLVPTYFILFQLLGCLGIGAYIANNKASVARANGLNPWWLGAFNTISAFNNSGMSLLDANMVAFQRSVYMLITMGLLILAGNTCYPVFLRLIVWTLTKIMGRLPDQERWEERQKTLQFLLDHPRRCYTNMFPARHTWWLLTSVVVLNGIDWIAFEVLNLGNDAITSLPAGIEALDGLFQALAVRSGGFYVVPIPSIRISLQVLYVIMMYISVYPVVITMRNSNIYEERSLGIYADDPGYAAIQEKNGSLFGRLRRTMTGNQGETKSYFVRQQLRAQLAHDLWWIVLAVFFIMIIEATNFERNPTVYSVFNVVFETVSAYGCVGISLGVPDEAYSFSGGLHKLSKLVLCAVMIRGRHRGLPVAIDKAILLPGEALNQAEEDDAAVRLERTVSRGRVV